MESGETNTIMNSRNYVDKLLKEYNKSKSDIDDYILEIEKVKGIVCDIFPKKVDYRNRHLIEDKIKIFTGFYATLLSLKKEKHNMIKNEITIRSGIKSDEDKDVDIRDIIKRMEKNNRS